MKVEIEKVRALIEATLIAKYDAIERMTGEPDPAIYLAQGTVDELRIEIAAALGTLTPWCPVASTTKVDRWHVQHTDGRFWCRSKRRDGRATPTLYKSESGAEYWANVLNARKA